MTVKELKEVLSNIDDEIEVLHSIQWSNTPEDIDHVYLIKSINDSDSNYVLLV